MRFRSGSSRDLRPGPTSASRCSTHESYWQGASYRRSYIGPVYRSQITPLAASPISAALRRINHRLLLYLLGFHMYAHKRTRRGVAHTDGFFRRSTLQLLFGDPMELWEGTRLVYWNCKSAVPLCWCGHWSSSCQQLLCQQKVHRQIESVGRPPPARNAAWSDHCWSNRFTHRNDDICLDNIYACTLDSIGTRNRSLRLRLGCHLSEYDGPQYSALTFCPADLFPDRHIFSMPIQCMLPLLWLARLSLDPWRAALFPFSSLSNCKAWELNIPCSFTP